METVEAERGPADREARGQEIQRDGDGNQDPTEEGERSGGGSTPRGAVVWRRTKTSLITSCSGGMLQVSGQLNGPLNEKLMTRGGLDQNRDQVNGEES